MKYGMINAWSRDREIEKRWKRESSILLLTFTAMFMYALAH